MNASLEKAFAKASSLPVAAQEQLAEQLLEDIEGEMKWDRALESSQELLEQMSSKALFSKRNGKTIAKGFDEL